MDLLRDNEEELTARRHSLLKALKEFRGYVTANAKLIPDYGDCWRSLARCQPHG
jgi:hypothetical protein